MTAHLIAIAAAGVAAALWVRGVSPRTLRGRLGMRANSRPLEAIRRLPAYVLAPVGVGVALLVLGDRINLIVLSVTLVGVAYAGLLLRRRARRRAERHRRQTETVEICDALVAELAVGTPPARALLHVAMDWSVMRPAARTADLGGDVAQTLRGLSENSGREALRDLAAAWDVSTRSGAGLAAVVERLGVALRSDDEARQEVLASLGPPRATARVLAGLPVLGLALGAGIGGDPIQVLLDSLIGAICLAIGSILAVVGLFWVEQIADGAEGLR